MPLATCRCGCGTEVTRAFAPGHALVHARNLRRRAQDGDYYARREMYEYGWALNATRTPGVRAFGFEAEFYGMSQGNAVENLRASGIDAQDDGYHHNTRPYWRVTEDGSVSGEGCELVSPVLHLSKKDDISLGRKALRAIRQNGGQINATCGLHVHHNLRGKTAIDLAETVGHWALFQPIINRVLPRSRHNGMYCQSMYDPQSWFNGVITRASSSGRAVDVRGDYFGRYHAINLQSISAHGTAEYRQHSGTLNGNKFEHWVRFTRAMHDVARIGSMQTLLDVYGGVSGVQRDMGVADMMKYLALPKATRAFYESREVELRSHSDDEGADEQACDSEPVYDENGNVWCDNCDEYHDE